MYDFGATGRQSCPIFFAFYLVFRTKCRKCPQVTLQNISGYSELMKKIIPRVARLWVPGVSPAASINFKGGEFFSLGGNICDTSGGTAARPRPAMRLSVLTQ